MAPTWERFESSEARFWPRVISVTGVLLFLSLVGEQVVYDGFRTEPLFTADFLLGFGLIVTFSGAIIYGGWWLGRSDLPDERHPRVVKWFAVGGAFYLAVNVPIILVWSPDTLRFTIGWVRFAVATGGLTGLLVGTVEARAIQRERSAERATVRAEAAERQRQWLDYLNGLLRHEVLNTANVITGYSSLLLENDDLDDEARAHVGTIHRRGTKMTNVIRDVRVLLETTRGTTELTEQNLTGVLRAELDDLCDTYESVEVDASVPDEVYVVADDLLPRVFSNLLVNAVEHNDGSTSEVDVTVEADSRTVTVRIADDGPGVPDEERRTLFERGDNTGSNHGLGLYLVRTLVERYEGTVELAETGDDGSTFVVELPVADREHRPTVGRRADPDAPTAAGS